MYVVAVCNPSTSSGQDATAELKNKFLSVRRNDDDHSCESSLKNSIKLLNEN